MPALPTPGQRGDVRDLGFFSALPPLLGIVVMMIVVRHFDRTLERRSSWAASVPAG